MTKIAVYINQIREEMAKWQSKLENFNENQLRHTSSSEIWVLNSEKITAKLSSAVLISKDWEFRKSRCYQKACQRLTLQSTAQTVRDWGSDPMQSLTDLGRDRTLSDVYLDLLWSTEFSQHPGNCEPQHQRQGLLLHSSSYQFLQSSV